MFGAEMDEFLGTGGTQSLPVRTRTDARYLTLEQAQRIEEEMTSHPGRRAALAVLLRDVRHDIQGDAEVARTFASAQIDIEQAIEYHRLALSLLELSASRISLALTERSDVEDIRAAARECEPLAAADAVGGEMVLEGVTLGLSRAA